MTAQTGVHPCHSDTEAGRRISQLLDFWSVYEAAQDEEPSNQPLSGLRVPFSRAPRGDLVCAS
jgi:hypothetical protein